MYCRQLHWQFARDRCCRLVCPARRRALVRCWLFLGFRCVCPVRAGPLPSVLACSGIQNSERVALGVGSFLDEILGDVHRLFCVSVRLWQLELDVVCWKSYFFAKCWDLVALNWGPLWERKVCGMPSLAKWLFSFHFTSAAVVEFRWFLFIYRRSRLSPCSHGRWQWRGCSRRLPTATPVDRTTPPAAIWGSLA